METPGKPLDALDAVAVEGGVGLPVSCGEETGHQITLYEIEKKTFDPLHAVPRECEFKSHVENIVGCLKQIEQIGRVPTEEQQNAPNRDFTLQLYIYVLRSCFPKISIRASYHCQSFEERKRSGSKVDYLGLFCPVPGWKQAHVRASECLSDMVRGKYLDNLEQLLVHSGKGPQLNPCLLGATDWLNFLESYSEFTDGLMAYKPNEYEHCISQHCSKVWGIQALPVEEGFYLTAAGRSAYHEMLTTCLGNTLLGLKLVSQLGDDVSGSLEEGEEIYDVLLFAAVSLRNLFFLAYHSPLLGFHLKWLLTMSSTAGLQQHTPDPHLGLIHGQRGETMVCQGLPQPAATRGSQFQRGEKRGADQLDTLEESSLQSEAGEMCEASDEICDSDIVPNFTFLRLGTDRLFPVRDGAVTSILRWLRLITLHACSIESLVHTDTCKKLQALDVKILQTNLPQVNMEMEPLEPCLKRLIPAPEDQDCFSREVERLSSNRTMEFGRTWHCEAVLLSLYLLSREGTDNDGVPRDLRMAATSLYPHIIAGSKHCCPVCSTLLRVVSAELQWKEIAVIGTHQTYRACALPPWLPKRFGDKVTEILERQLRVAVNERLKVLRGHRQFGRASGLPTLHGTIPVSAFLSFSAALRETDSAFGAKRWKRH